MTYAAKICSELKNACERAVGVGNVLDGQQHASIWTPPDMGWYTIKVFFLGKLNDPDETWYTINVYAGLLGKMGVGLGTVCT